MSGVRAGSFTCNREVGEGFKLTCSGQAVTTKRPTELSSYKCNWEAPPVGTDAATVHCNVRLLSDLKWVSLSYTLKEGKPATTAGAANIVPNDMLFTTAENLLAYNFDAKLRHEQFIEALKQGDTDMIYGQLHPDIELFFDSQKV